MNAVVYRTSRAVYGAWLRLWNRMRVEGHDNVPRSGGVLIVSNHSSYLDPPIVGTTLRRRVHFLARSTLGRFRPFRWLLDGLGVVFVDRDGSPREGIAGAIEVLRDGRMVCIFPEGTRSRTGHVGEFKRGALLLLKRAAVPVVPVGIEGSFAALRRGMLWPRPAKVTVRYGVPMPAAEVLAPGGVDELRRRVRELAHDPEDESADRAAPASGPAGGAAPPESASSDPVVAGSRRHRSPANDGSEMCVVRPTS